MSRNSNEVMLAYFNEVRNLNVITSNLIDTLNRTNDNLLMSLNRYLISNTENTRESGSRNPTNFFGTSSLFSNEPYTRTSPRTNSFQRSSTRLSPSTTFTSSGTSTSPILPPPPPRTRNSLRTHIPRRSGPLTEERIQSENGEIVLTGIVDMTPVSVFPSTRQVINATEILRFGDIEGPLNENCPITMEAFTENDSVCRIKHCKHIFKERALYNWFVEHVGCPVCRFDIRDDEANSNVPNEEYGITSTQLSDELISSFSTLLSEFSRGPRIDISATNL
tara:strand:+ start:336 stop:1169 length:834 start_codon:yes stop_codon:yes gene_type:complete